MHKLFVYGTLMQEGSNNFMLQHGTFLHRAVLHGFALYDLGSFPGIRLSTGNFVQGELYDVSDGILAITDILEGVRYGYYTRELVNVVVTENGASNSYEAFTYVFGRPITRGHIPSGDWREKYLDDLPVRVPQD